MTHNYESFDKIIPMEAMCSLDKIEDYAENIAGKKDISVDEIFYNVGFDPIEYLNDRNPDDDFENDEFWTKSAIDNLYSKSCISNALDKYCTNKAVKNLYGFSDCQIDKEKVEEEKEKIKEKWKKINKKVDAIVGIGLIGTGAYFYSTYSKLNEQNEIIENTVDQYKKLFERGFIYESDEISDNLNISKIIPENCSYDIWAEGGMTGIRVFLSGNISKDIQTFQALKDLGTVVKYENSSLESMDCFRFLNENISKYYLDVPIIVSNSPNDIKKPLNLSTEKSGDCEDYSLLLACALEHQGIDTEITLVNGHAIVSIGTSNNEFIPKNEIYIGSTEYIKNKNLTLRDINENLSKTCDNSQEKTVIRSDKIIKEKLNHPSSLNRSISSEIDYANIGLDYLNESYPDIWKKYEDFDTEESGEEKKKLILGIHEKENPILYKTNEEFLKELQNCLNNETCCKIAYETIHS